MSSPEPPAVGASGAGSAGVIHDIGYRSYDGPRLGRGYILRSLYVQGVRSTFGLGRTARAKVLPALLLAATVLPAVIVVVVEVYAKADVQAISYNRYACSCFPSSRSSSPRRRRSSSPAICGFGP